jgi:hypothetical protein
LNGHGQFVTYVQLPFLDPTVYDVRVPTTESAAVCSRQKIDPLGTRGKPSDRAAKPFSVQCGAEGLRSHCSDFSTTEGHLKNRAKSEPSEQPSGCQILVLDHRSKLRESGGASVAEEAGQEPDSKTLPSPRSLDPKATHPTFAATEVMNPAKGDPTFSLYPRPESSVPSPLINVLQEIVVGIGLGQELPKAPDFMLRIDAV